MIIPAAALLVLLAGSAAWAHEEWHGTEHGESGRSHSLEMVLGDLVEDGQITRGELAELPTSRWHHGQCDGRHHHGNCADRIGRDVAGFSYPRVVGYHDGHCANG